MAHYHKIDDECSENAVAAKSAYYNKEEHLEIDLFQRDADLRHRYLTCAKNPGHECFVPIKDMTMEDLPETLRHQCVLDYVAAFSKVVVRVKVKSTSDERPKEDPFRHFAGRSVMRSATGCVTKIVDTLKLQEIPCKDGACIMQGIDHSVYGFIDIRTNRHMVYDNLEARSTDIEFFYDSPDRLSIVTLTGHEISRDTGDEECVIVRCVTHDVDFIKKVHRLVEDAKILGVAIPRSVKDCSMTDFAISISHPHGTAKSFSVGSLVEYRKVPEKAPFLRRVLRHVAGKQRLRLRVTTYTTPTCSGCTGAPIITGYDDGWGWWSMGHSTAELSSGINMAFTV